MKDEDEDTRIHISQDPTGSGTSETLKSVIQIGQSHMPNAICSFELFLSVSYPNSEDTRLRSDLPKNEFFYSPQFTWPTEMTFTWLATDMLITKW